MDTIDDDYLQDLMTPVADSDIEPAHRAWMNELIEYRMARKANGETTYTSLDQVRRELGIDAP